MKMIVKLYRVTTVPMREFLASALGIDPERDLFENEMNRLIKERYGPIAPRFKIFFPAESADARKLVVGIEAMTFDILEAKVPMSGLVLADPVKPQDVDRIDGAIESELNRMNLWTEFQNFEWRLAYELKGN